MPAYIIVEIEVTDPVGYEEYKNLAGATVEKYGGKYIVRGGKTEVLEGGWQPKRIVVLKFETMERARQWLDWCAIDFDLKGSEPSLRSPDFDLVVVGRSIDVGLAQIDPTPCVGGGAEAQQQKNRNGYWYCFSCQH